MTFVGGSAVLVTVLTAAVFTQTLRNRNPAQAEPPPTLDTAAEEPTIPPPAQLAGEWKGRWRTHPSQLRLAGANDTLRGELVVNVGEHTVSARLEGRYDSESRVLHLRDIGHYPEAGIYEVTLGDGDVMLSGTFTTRSDDPPGSVAWVRMDRVHGTAAPRVGRGAKANPGPSDAPQPLD